MARFCRFGLLLPLLALVSSPLFADSVHHLNTDSGEPIIVADVDVLTFDNHPSSDFSSDWNEWAHNNALDSDKDGNHWGWDHKHHKDYDPVGGDNDNGGWDDDNGASKGNPAVPEPSVPVLLASGVVSLFLVSVLGKLRA